MIGDPNFPQNPKEALRRGFEAAEREFLELAQIDEEDGILERSGSCALVALIVGTPFNIVSLSDLQFRRNVLHRKRRRQQSGAEFWLWHQDSPAFTRPQAK